MLAGLTLDEWLQQLAGAAGLVFIVTQAIQPLVPDDKREKFMPSITLAVGVVIAELGAVLLGGDNSAFLSALAAGILAGGMVITGKVLVNSASK